MMMLLLMMMDPDGSYVGDGTLVMDGDTYKCILMDICRYNMM